MASFALEVYRLAAAALAPLAARKLARAAADGDDAARQDQRHGRVSAGGGETWLHAASVGELNAAEPLIRALLERHPDMCILVSTLTSTGAAECARRFAAEPRVRHLYAPLDSRSRVTRWLDATRPARLLLVETELWPELLTQCRARSIPVALVNARLSDRAFPRYRRLRWLLEPALAGIAPLLCQTESDARRYVALGASTDAVRVCGNLKLDRDALPQASERVREWMMAARPRPLWVAGSTHAGEEDILSAAHALLLRRVPDALLIMVPRHPERTDAALQSIRGAGLEAARIEHLNRNSELREISAAVVDRMGVLAELYPFADACFVGGTLIEGVGGHNLFEPALAGRPVLTGPYRNNQRETAEGLIRARALLEVHDAASLARQLETLLGENNRTGDQLGRQARRWAEAQRGAVARTLAALEPGLSRAPDRSEAG